MMVLRLEERLPEEIIGLSINDLIDVGLYMIPVYGQFRSTRKEIMNLEDFEKISLVSTAQFLSYVILPTALYTLFG